MYRYIYLQIFYTQAKVLSNEIGSYKPEMSKFTMLQKSKEMMGSAVCLLMTSILQNQKFHA